MIGAREDSAAPRRRPVRMARPGESHAVFVVQRSFRRVRRGYDPDEVERHLQLVSEWFTKTHAGESLREYEHSQREGLEAEATLEGARIKAEATAREAEAELAAAREEAAALAEQARAEAGALVEQARAEAAPRVEQPGARAPALVDQARLDAAWAESVTAAEAEAARLRGEAAAE